MITSKTVMSCDRLRQTLVQLRTKRFVLVQPGGNFGDQLIYVGMRELARSTGIEFSELSFEEFAVSTCFPGDAVLYIHGGGGYVPWWSGRAYKAIVHGLHVGATDIIVGPSTLHSDVRYIRELFDPVVPRLGDANFHFFTRDQLSYELLRDTSGGSFSVCLDEDTALKCTRNTVLDAAGLSPEDTERRGYTLCAVRSDAEMHGEDAVSSVYCPIDPIAHCRTMKEWVKLHVSASRIVTNRLHSAIAGVVLGIPTTLLPNSYHKNRSVYDYSLSKRGVEWSESVPAELRSPHRLQHQLAALLTPISVLQHIYSKMYFKGMV